MEAITSPRCCKLSWRPSSKNLRSQKSAQRRMVVRASAEEARDRDHWGSSVDKNMIVLRLRIKEMKMLETNQEAPSDWMGWEKRYYAHYDEDVCEAMGLLQSYLMSVRPSVALGMLVLVAFSVIKTCGVGLFHALEIAKRILSWFGSTN